jgi:hypothetical protein
LLQSLAALAHHHGIEVHNALAELSLGDADRHDIVGRNNDPGVDLRSDGGVDGPWHLPDLAIWAGARCGIQKDDERPAAAAAVDRRSRRDKSGLLRSLLIIIETSSRRNPEAASLIALRMRWCAAAARIGDLGVDLCIGRIGASLQQS